MTVALALLAGLLTTAPPPGVDDSARPSAQVSWRAVDLDGRVWSSESLRGRVVLIDFWATWCAPCLAELPRLRQLHARYDTRDLVILGISLDRSSARDFRSWLQRQDIGWPQVREVGGYDSPLAAQFGVEVLPASFLVGRDGRLVGRDLRGEALTARVRQLVEAR
jgi:thiol-disulfide isomerase/thioredoxin